MKNLPLTARSFRLALLGLLAATAPAVAQSPAAAPVTTTATAKSAVVLARQLDDYVK